MGEEKRRHFRWREKVRVTYSALEEELYQEIFTKNLSERGLQILVNKKLYPNQTVRLKLEFAYDSVPVMGLGKIAYVESCGEQFRAGVEFMEMSDFDNQRLRRNLEKIREEFKK